jgi:hypothetical protein
VKTAELLADLRCAEQHDPDEAEEVRRRFMDRETSAPAES